MSISAGLTLGAGSAFAQSDRIDDLVWGYDEKCSDADEDIESYGEIDFDDGYFDVWGNVTGQGTDGDDVEIRYYTQEVNNANANDKSGNVQQRYNSTLCVIIASAVDARDENTCIEVEKCAVRGNTNINEQQERVRVSTSANCSGTDLYDFLTSDQVTTVEAAFPRGNKCGINFRSADPGKKSSLSIKMNDKDGDID